MLEMRILLLFITLNLVVKNSIYVKNHIPDQKLGKYEDLEFVIAASDVFGNTDNSRTEISLLPNKWISSSFVEPYFESQYRSIVKIETVGEKIIQCGGDEEFIYVVADKEFFIIDVQDLTNPTIVSIVSNGQYFKGLFVEGNYAYISDENDFINIYDISNKTNPLLIKKIDEVYSPSFVTVRDDILFVGSNLDTARYLKIINVTDKTNPEFLGSVLMGYLGLSQFVKSIFLDGEFAHVTAAKRMWVVDISDLSSPIRIQQYISSVVSTTYYREVFVKNNCSYILRENVGVEVIDISNKTHSFMKYLIPSTGASALYMPYYNRMDDQDTQLYLSDILGITLYNLRNLSSPEIIGKFEHQQLYSCCGNNEILFVDAFIGGLVFVNFTNRTQPEFIVEEFGYIDVAHIAVEGNTMYAASHMSGLKQGDTIGYGKGGLKIIDLEDTFRPKTVSSLYVLGNNKPAYVAEGGIAISGDFLYLCFDSKIHILNVSDQDKTPEKVFEVYVPYCCNHIKVVMSSEEEKEYVYALEKYGSANHQMHIVDVTDKSESYVIGSVDGLMGYHQLDVSGNYAFVAASTEMTIINCTNKTHPSILTSMEVTPSVSSSDVMSVKVINGFVFVTDGSMGLSVINISDISNPSIVGNMDMMDAGWVTTAIDEDDGCEHAYVADGEGGCRIVNVGDIISRPRTLEIIEPPELNQPETPSINRVSSINQNLYLSDGENNRVYMYRSELKLVGNEDTFPMFCGETEVTIRMVSLSDRSSAEDTFVVSRENYCNDHGTCLKDFSCDCEEGYDGKNCEKWRCGDLDLNAFGKVCSGHGSCIAPDECECFATWYGKECGESLLLVTLLYPFIFLLSIVCGIVVGSTVCVICVCCCLVFGFVSVFLCTSSLIYVEQTRGLKKYSQLANFDLLLKEQELEKDTSLANLKINESLFEISKDDIELLGHLGDGGSESVVYRAKWAGQTIAYKCFKTRNVCVSQDNFDRFEKEVNIMGSVSHPNILRFFGCCLAPPRIGILTELCPHGDLEHFLKAKITECEESESSVVHSYPIEEKIRMCSEIINAMEYLHSKNVIHRDLKPQNVLLDSGERTKIMDFGLSKIVKNMSQVKTQKIGTSFFMAPELILSPKYDEKCDVFSFSIMLYVIFTENFFPYGKDCTNIEIQVANNPDLRPRTLDMVKKLPPRFRCIAEIAKLCWIHEPLDRYSFSQLYKLFTEMMGDRDRKGEVPSKLLLSLEREAAGPVSTNTKHGEETTDIEASLLIGKEKGRVLRLENEKLRMKVCGLKEEYRKLLTKMKVDPESHGENLE